MPWPPRIMFALVLTCLLAPATVRGQEPPVQVPLTQRAVIDAPNRTFRVGDTFRLNVSKDELRAAGGVSEIRARIIRGDRAYLSGLRPGEDGCVSLPSSLLAFREENGGLLFGFAFSEEWLRLTPDNRPVEQVYVVVFERATSDSRFVRIRKDQLDEYLRLGFPIVVAPPPAISPQALANLRRFARTPSGIEDQPCRRLAHVGGLRGTTATLVSCDSGTQGVPDLWSEVSLRLAESAQRFGEAGVP